uniref:Protein fixC n=1 Tax=Lygus hesperus TaxID=30085 RepID=A0A0A9WAF8_LYGHE
MNSIPIKMLPSLYATMSPGKYSTPLLYPHSQDTFLSRPQSMLINPAFRLCNHPREDSTPPPPQHENFQGGCTPKSSAPRRYTPTQTQLHWQGNSHCYLVRL